MGNHFQRPRENKQSTHSTYKEDLVGSVKETGDLLSQRPFHVPATLPRSVWDSNMDSFPGGLCAFEFKVTCFEASYQSPCEDQGCVLIREPNIGQTVPGLLLRIMTHFFSATSHREGIDEHRMDSSNRIESQERGKAKKRGIKEVMSSNGEQTKIMFEIIHCPPPPEAAVTNNTATGGSCTATRTGTRSVTLKHEYLGAHAVLTNQSFPPCRERTTDQDSKRASKRGSYGNASSAPQAAAAVVIVVYVNTTDMCSMTVGDH